MPGDIFQQISSGGGQAAPPQPQTAGADIFQSLSSGAYQPDTGATPDTGLTRNPDGSFVVTPKEGESFSDTMRRAAAMGKTVTPQQIQSQTVKGLKEAPAVLAAAPVIGAAGAASGAAVNEVATALPSVIPHTIEGIKAVGTWANANPFSAYMLLQTLKAIVPGFRKAAGFIKGTPEVGP